MFRALLLVFALVPCLGCGTIMNLNRINSLNPLATTDSPDKKFVFSRMPYGGVLLDGAFGGAMVYEQDQRFWLLLPGLYILLIDLPLSAVGDTLTLPITLPAAIDRCVGEHYFELNRRLNDESDDEDSINAQDPTDPSDPSDESQQLPGDADEIDSDSTNLSHGPVHPGLWKFDRGKKRDIARA
ncbi:MAG: YceK/YidQ family lipoprotein [Planctomycetota bacterium]|nr:YceK/YidQ family lipoprotein [Planctomycetota bacterium]